MTLFTEKSLNLLPSQALTGLSNSLLIDKAEKQVKLATANSKIAKLEGTSTLRTPQKGKITVSAGGAPAAKQREQSLAAPAKSASNSASLLNDPTGNPTAAPVFTPGTVPADTSPQDISDMSSEVDSYYESEAPLQSSITATKTAVAQLAVAALLTAISRIDETSNAIANILEKRASGELPNPQLNFSALDVGTLPPSTLEKINIAMDNNQQFIQTQIIAPFAENQRVLNSLRAQASGILAADSPIFDLDFGPPISTDNRFVLSKDGLYYNSRTEKVPNIIPYPVS